MAPWEARGPVGISAPAHTPLLVVDDDEDVRETVCVAAEDAGYRVEEAASVGDARSYLRVATSSHVVLLGFLFPSENADELLRVVSVDEALQRHCFVLMPAIPPTRFSDEAQRLIAIWCNEVVTKPFDLATLFAAIQRAEALLSQCH
jgi:DNA-binding NtrC family response regulator